MPSTPVARTEYRRYLRGKTPWIVGVCFVLLSRLTTPPGSEEIEILTDAVVLANAQVAVAVIVPFAATALGFRAIIQEREAGTARILLGTKLTRRRFVLEMVLGRGLALLVPILGGTILVVGYDAVQYGRFSVTLLAGFLGLSTVYVFAWTGILVGLSAAGSSTTRAVIAGSVVTISFAFWDNVTLAFLWQIATGSPPGNQMAYPTVFAIAEWVSPMSAYNVLTNWLFGVPVGPDRAVTQVSDAISETGRFTPTAAPIPAWCGVGFLLVWPVVSLLGGTAMLRRADITPSGGTGVFGTLVDHCPSVPWFSGHRFRSTTGRDGVVDALPGSWQPLARREFSRLVRTSLVWVVGLLVLVAGVASLSPDRYVQAALGPRVPLAALQTPLGFLGGFGVLFGTFRAVIRERTTGSIRLTAGTGVSRTATLVGLVVGRASAFAVPIVAAVFLTCLVAVPQYGVVPLTTFAGFLVFTLVFVVGMAALGVTVSTIVRSQSVAGVTVLLFAVVHVAWYSLSNTIYGTLTGTSVTGFAPPENPTYLFVRWLPPLQLFNVVTNAIIGVPNSAGSATGVISELQPNYFSNIVVVRIDYGVDVPAWYLHPGVSGIQLGLWFVLPFGLALLLYRYRSID
ncbi:ABC transporter permease [Haloarcula halophila]|uniref:ABC transporter permease n=1 Tax=Haloarcula TaxID=2237 RepID=UPI0023E45C3B|nr:ABC transporter permease subunit [Halomicroarcula sp. DFY41]